MNSWSSSGRPAAANRPCCGSSRGSSRSPAAISSSATSASTACRPRNATSPWCSRIMRFIRICASTTIWRSRSNCAAWPKPEIDTRVRQAAALLHIEAYLDRKPKELSGGQRQRVAMGRAIVRNPQVFLFDEPLSNLDAKLRAQVRAEIKSLSQQLRTTMVFVTHDQIEAMTMADRIVVLQSGIVQQYDTPGSGLRDAGQPVRCRIYRLADDEFLLRSNCAAMPRRFLPRRQRLRRSMRRRARD